jgi:hypothetical protein
MRSNALTAAIGSRIICRKRRAQLQAGQAQLQRQLEHLTEAYLSGIVALAEYQRREGIERQAQGLEQTEGQLAADSKQQSQVARSHLKIKKVVKFAKKNRDCSVKKKLASASTLFSEVRDYGPTQSISLRFNRRPMAAHATFVAQAQTQRAHTC